MKFSFSSDFEQTELLVLPFWEGPKSAADYGSLQIQAALKDFTGSLELLHAIYLASSQAGLVGVVPLANIALARRDTPLRELTVEQLISVPFHADQKEVINMFRKYNLLSLPVVDDNDRLLGIVTADDVLELVTKEN